MFLLQKTTTGQIIASNQKSPSQSTPKTT